MQLEKRQCRHLQPGCCLISRFRYTYQPLPDTFTPPGCTYWRCLSFPSPSTGKPPFLCWDGLHQHVACLREEEAASPGSGSSSCSPAPHEYGHRLFNSVTRNVLYNSLTLFVDNCYWCGISLQMLSHIGALFFFPQSKENKI